MQQRSCLKICPKPFDENLHSYNTHTYILITGVKISNDGRYEGYCYVVIKSCLTLLQPHGL